MAKHTYTLKITTTFVKYEEYESDYDAQEDVLEQAYADVDLLDNDLDNAEIDTKIKIVNKKGGKR